MVGRGREILESVQRTLRAHRKAIYLLGVVSLVSGLVIDFASISSHIRWLEYPGMVLPVVGSILLLLNYVTAHTTRGMLNHTEAVDEVVFGTSIYLYLGLCIITLLVLSPGVLDYIQDRTSSLYIAIPRIIVLVDLTGVPLMVYFLLIVSALVLSFNALTKNGFTMYLRIMRGHEVPPECSDADSFFGNALSTMIWAIFAYVFFAYAFYIVLAVAGLSPLVPDLGDNTPGLVYSLSRAAVWEELNDRVLLLGVPLLVIDHIFRRGRTLKLRQYFLGGGMQFGYVESGAALFSAIMFALSHVEYWDFYKVAPTFVGGLFLAYMFMKFGLYASMMMHFTVNLFDIPFMAIGEEIPIPLIFALLGLISFLYYSRSLWSFVAHDLMKIPKKPKPVPAQVPSSGAKR